MQMLYNICFMDMRTHPAKLELWLRGCKSEIRRDINLNFVYVVAKLVSCSRTKFDSFISNGVVIYQRWRKNGLISFGWNFLNLLCLQLCTTQGLVTRAILCAISCAICCISQMQFGVSAIRCPTRITFYLFLHLIADPIWCAIPCPFCSCAEIAHAPNRRHRISHQIARKIAWYV
jgi:hypothetical protein